MREHPNYLSRKSLRTKHGAVVFGDVLYQPEGVCGPRIQPDHQLVVIHKGFLNLRLDREIIQVPEGYGILLSPGHQEHFLFATECETRHSWCAIEPRAVPRSLRAFYKRFRGPIPFLGKMSRLLEMGQTGLLLAQDKDEPLENGIYLGLALALLSEFACAVRQSRLPNDAAESILARMTHFISMQYMNPLSLNDIARAAGVSRQHLLSLCRSRGESTPMEQLYEKRLRIASDLLLHTGFSISEIADRCGFANSFHFSRRFKQANRSSPLAWRKANWMRDSG